MRPRGCCVAAWLAVVAVLCGLAWGQAGCSNKVSCSACTQIPDCMWCGRRGNFTGEEGKSLSRCIKRTDDIAAEWRDACGINDVHDYIPGAEACNFHGIYQCGECLCDKGYLGSRCECGSNNPWGFGGSFDDSSCRQTNTSAICNSRGTCTCGECKCNERENPEEIIGGPYCECTNFLCMRFNGLLCGGPDHGVCECNKCNCMPGWTGDDCMCEDNKDNCINPVTGDECSNQGECECNQCKCFESEDGRYSGKYCEDCPTCRGKCVPYKACVQCQIFQTGEFTPEECATNCIQFSATAVDIAVEEEGERLCTFFDENDCRFKFVYGYDDDKEPVVRVQQTLECPPTREILNNSGGQSPGSMGAAVTDSHTSVGVNSEVFLGLWTLSLSVLVLYV